MFEFNRYRRNLEKLTKRMEDKGITNGINEEIMYRLIVFTWFLDL
jgi:hypothetical protein